MLSEYIIADCVNVPFARVVFLVGSRAGGGGDGGGGDRGNIK